MCECVCVYGVLACLPRSHTRVGCIILGLCVYISEQLNKKIQLAVGD